jgi:hypothetical protein
MTTETSKPRRKADDSGNIHLDQGSITDTSKAFGSFSIALSDVALIGEFTTESGPFIDDWFMVFVPCSRPDWFEASMYAQGGKEFREQLSSALASPIHGSLAASTNFCSRIIWPTDFADRPLFTFAPVKDPGVFRRLQLAVLPEVSHRLSADVISAIQRKRVKES